LGKAKRDLRKIVEEGRAPISIWKKKELRRDTPENIRSTNGVNQVSGKNKKRGVRFHQGRNKKKKTTIGEEKEPGHDVLYGKKLTERERLIALWGSRKNRENYVRRGLQH